MLQKLSRASFETQDGEMDVLDLAIHAILNRFFQQGKILLVNNDVT